MDKFEAWKTDKRKIIQDIADFLHDLYGGTYDGTLDKLSIEDCKEPNSVDWAKNFVPVAAIIQKLRLHGSAVSTTAVPTAPPLMNRTIQRMKSDPMSADLERVADIQRERQDVWRKATLERTK